MVQAAPMSFVSGWAHVALAVLLAAVFASQGAAAGEAALASTPTPLPQLPVQPALAPPQALWQPVQDEPPLPGIQDGLGPGSAMQQRTDGSGYICTAAFLLRDPFTGTYYLATAGHCLVRDETDPTPYTGAANADKMHEEFSICVSGCIDNALGVGTYVTLKPNDLGHPAVYARSGGVGADFGILRLPGDVHDLLRPAMPQWGGPTGIDAGASGDTYVHFGHGSYCCPEVGSVASRTPVDQGRIAVSLGANDDSFDALGSISGGDSGSAISRGVTSGDILSGAEAVGVITHGTVGVGVIMSGTVLTKGLAMVQAATGLELELVLAGDPLPRGATATPPEPVPDGLAIRSPAHGSSIDVAGKKVLVEGSADIDGGWIEGSQVQLALDDPEFGFEDRIPVRGNTTWNATWDLAGASLGHHILRARLVGAAGDILAQHNVTVTLTKDASSSSSSSTTRPPGGSSSSGATAPSSGSAPSSSANQNSKSSPIPALGLPAALAGLALLALVRRRL